MRMRSRVVAQQDEECEKNSGPKQHPPSIRESEQHRCQAAHVHQQYQQGREACPACVLDSVAHFMGDDSTQQCRIIKEPSAEYSTT